MSGFPYIFTFYSYKGGVGRSMAALNVAYTLAGWGRHVLLLDMDLEAPGLSGFLLRSDELERPGEDHGDIVDFVRAAHDLPENWRDTGQLEQLPPVAHYARRVRPEKLEPLAPRMGHIGRLDVVVADEERDYLERHARLDLASYDRDRLAQLSFRLWKYLKAQRLTPASDEMGAGASEVPYDYVIVDSRTGITETGGLCIGPLADRLVVFTGLNDQNVEGTRLFLEEAGIQLETRAEGAPLWDDADRVTDEDGQRVSLGPKPTILVASPVPYGEIEYKRDRLAKVEERIGRVATTLSYHPRLALMETTFVRDFPEEHLSSQYRELADQVTRRVGDDVGRLADRANRHWRNGEKAAAVEAVIRLAPQDPTLGAGLLGSYEEALTSAEPVDVRLMDSVYEALVTAGTETAAGALYNWGWVLSNQAEAKTGDEADRLFEQSYQKLARALELKPDMHEALSNWGSALLEQAKTKTGDEADRLFEQSYEKCAKAMELKPDKHAALYNWGLALSYQAETKTGDEADQLFERSYEMYARALELKPDMHEAVYNLACHAALRGDVATCLERLREARRVGGHYARQEIEDDSDFADVLDHADMQRFLAELDAESERASGKQSEPRREAPDGPCSSAGAREGAAQRRPDEA